MLAASRTNALAFPARRRRRRDEDAFVRRQALFCIDGTVIRFAVAFGDGGVLFRRRRRFSRSGDGDA
jgi:hypothetical protein